MGGGPPSPMADQFTDAVIPAQGGLPSFTLPSWFGRITREGQPDIRFEAIAPANPSGIPIRVQHADLPAGTVLQDVLDGGQYDVVKTFTGPNVVTRIDCQAAEIITVTVPIITTITVLQWIEVHLYPSCPSNLWVIHDDHIEPEEHQIDAYPPQWFDLEGHHIFFHDTPANANFPNDLAWTGDSEAAEPLQHAP